MTEFLRGFLKNGEILNTESKLLYADYYIVFYQYATGQTDFTEFSAYMNNRWYDSNEAMYWYDSHKKKEDVYTGYWCWLAAALMKIRKATCKDVSYVPVDLI